MITFRRAALVFWHFTMNRWGCAGVCCTTALCATKWVLMGGVVAVCVDCWGLAPAIEAAATVPSIPRNFSMESVFISSSRRVSYMFLGAPGGICPDKRWVLGTTPCVSCVTLKQALCYCQDGALPAASSAKVILVTGNDRLTTSSVCQWYRSWHNITAGNYRQEAVLARTHWQKQTGNWREAAKQLLNNGDYIGLQNLEIANVIWAKYELMTALPLEFTDSVKLKA